MTTGASIRDIRDDCNRRIAGASEALCRLQEVCPHETLTKRYRGDTGNYDPSADAYWIEWECGDCGHRWTTPQGRDYVNKYPWAKDITR